MKKKKNNYEIKQVEAWWNPCDGWTYNQSWHICYVTTSAENLSRVFYNVLKKNGIIFKRGRTIYTDGFNNFIEIIDRKTKEPLFCMIPMD